MFDKKIWGARLRQLRIERNEKQDDLAALLHVTRVQISDMETGKSSTTFERLVMLCEYYQVSADYLLGLSDKR